MQKKLHLMSELALRSYIEASRSLQTMAVGMPANDVKENTKYVLESAQINEIPEDGNIKLSIDNDGTAHIPVMGVLTNSVTPSAAFESKAITTYNFVSAASELADNSNQVKNVVYEFNTNGGDVDGAEPAALAIAKVKKPTTARVHSAAQSAGVLLASQADKIVAIGKMSMFGSVGVAAEFKDRTAAEEKAGIKSIILTSTDAPEKRLDIKTDEGQKATIKWMDEVHQAMAEHIATGRKTTVEKVNKNFGRGGTMTAERALAVGMIDEIEGVTTQSTTNAGAPMVASTEQAHSGQQPGQAPAIQTEGKMEEKEFLAFLESTPEAKAFYENKLSDHAVKIGEMKTDHETALTEARTEIEGNKLSVEEANFTGSIMMSPDYLTSTRQAGIEVFKGKIDMKMFKMLVANADQTNELIKQAKIQANQPAATGGQDHDLDSDDAKISADAQALGEKFGTAKKGV